MIRLELISLHLFGAHTPLGRRIYADADSRRIFAILPEFTEFLRKKNHVQWPRKRRKAAGQPLLGLLGVVFFAVFTHKFCNSDVSTDVQNMYKSSASGG